MPGRRRMFLGAVLLATTGCYTFQPVRPGDAVLDTRVRATVSARQAAELAPVMRNVTPTISGRLVDRSDEGVTLDVAMHGSMTGMSSSPLHSRVVIPVGELVSLESRTLSLWRTSLVGGVIVAAVSASWVALSGESTVDDKPKTGTDNAIRIRIPIGLPFR